MPATTSGSPSSVGGGPEGAEAGQRSLEDRVAEEQAAALREPGPSWRQWLFQSAFRAYFLLGMLIVDAQIVVFWYEVGSTVGLVAFLILAVYLEFLLYRYLWYRPRFDAPAPRRFRRTWLRPAEYGRWTPEAELVRAGGSIYAAEQGPNPKEFL